MSRLTKIFLFLTGNHWQEGVGVPGQELSHHAACSACLILSLLVARLFLTSEGVEQAAYVKGGWLQERSISRLSFFISRLFRSWACESFHAPSLSAPTRAHE